MKSCCVTKKKEKEKEISFQFDALCMQLNFSWICNITLVVLIQHASVYGVSL